MACPTENGTAHDAEAADGAAPPSRWMQADAAEPDIGSERDISRLGESVVKVSKSFCVCAQLFVILRLIGGADLCCRQQTGHHAAQ